MATKKKKKVVRRLASRGARARISSSASPVGLAVIALILNIIILPGLGSIVARKTRTGIWQVVLALVGALLYFVSYVGVPLILAAWIWGIVTGVSILQESRR